MLAEVRHGTVGKLLNPYQNQFRRSPSLHYILKEISVVPAGGGPGGEAGISVRRWFRDPAEADLAPIRCGKGDVGALQGGQQSQRFPRDNG